MRRMDGWTGARMVVRTVVLGLLLLVLPLEPPGLRCCAPSGGLSAGHRFNRPSVRPSLGPALLHAQAGLTIGAPAPAVTINDLDGVPYDFRTFLGSRPALIEFWATWCSLCEALLPQVQAAAARYGDEIVLIGVNVTVNQSEARVRRYLERHRPPFRTLWDHRGVAVRAYEVPGTSFIVIVDREGRVAYTGIGEDQDLAAELRKVVGR